jgi:hypothetical protein
MGMILSRMSVAACLLWGAGAHGDVIEFDVAKIRVYIQSSEDPPATPVGYVFNTFIDSDDGDASVAFINGNVLLEDSPGQWNYEEQFATQSMLDVAYPPGGTYTLELNGGTLGARTEQLTLTTPEEYPAAPAITPASLASMQNADPEQDLTIEWVAPDANTTVIFMSIYSDSLGDTILDDLIPVDQGSYTIPASDLLPGDTYEVEIVFVNAEIGSGSPSPGFGADALSLSGYASVTATQFTTSGAVIEFDGTILKTAFHLQTADDAVDLTPEIWTLEAFISAKDGAFKSGNVTGGAISLDLTEYSPGNWDVDDPSIEYTSKSAFDAAFPSLQNYAMSVQGGTWGERSQNFFIGSDAYPVPGQLTGSVFSNLQGMDPDTDFVLEWSQASPGVDLVAIFIDRASDFASVYEVILPATSTGVMIPAGTLQEAEEYVLGLSYVDVVQFTGDGPPAFDTTVRLGAGYLTDTIVNFATLNLNACAADLNGDGLLNFFDVSAFLVAFNAQDPSADFNGDELFNFFDVSAFLVVFQGGCL